MVVTSILCQTNGRSTIFMTSTLGQIGLMKCLCLLNNDMGHYCSTGFACCCEFDRCECLQSKLCSYSNQVKN